MISQYLAFYAQKEIVLRAAPTGVAAHNIHASTLHQLLSIPVNRDFGDLDNERLARLQNAFRDCELLISSRNIVRLYCGGRSSKFFA